MAKAPARTPAPDDRGAPAGWAFFPPIQRIVGDQPTLTRTDAFTRSLPAWGNPSFMGAMTHLVSSDGPSGVVDADGRGLGVPRLTAYTPELPLLQQRSHASARQTDDPEIGAENGEQSEIGAANVEQFEVQRAVAGSLVTPHHDEAAPQLSLPRAAATEQSVRRNTPTARAGGDPRFNENATNDGKATIVSLPTARPLQRQTEEPVKRPILGEPGQRRLGLGRPLVNDAHPPAASATPTVARSADVPLPLVPTTVQADTAPDLQDDGLMPDGSAMASSVSAAPPAAFSAGRQVVESVWAPSPSVMPALPVAATATGLLSAQRLVTAGLERSLAPRAASAGARRPSGSSGSGRHGSRSEGVVQRATVLAPAAPAPEHHISQTTADQRDDTPQALATAPHPLRAIPSAPKSAPSTAVVQRDFGGLPLGLPKESGLRDAVSSAESKAKSDIAAETARAENAVRPAEDAVADLPRTAGAVPAAAGAGASSPQDVDALAEKLMIPLLRRFKSEMLLDRERRGLRTDAF